MADLFLERSEIVELISLFLISFIALFVFANTGIGPGMIMQIGYWSLYALGFLQEAELTAVLVYLSFSKYPMAMLQSIIKRKYILFQYKYALILLTSVFFSTAIGIFVLVRLESLIFVRILGGLLLISLIIACVKESVFKRKHNEIIPLPDQNILQRYKRYAIEDDVAFYQLNCPRTFWLILTALVSGFSRGLFGVGGPPFIIYQLFTNFDRRSFRALMSFADGFGSGVMTIIILLFVEHKFNPSQWLRYLVVFIAAIFGLMIGNVCAKFVDERAFKVTMQFLLFCGAINLLFTGIDLPVCFSDIGCYEASVCASAMLSFLFVVVFIGLAVRSCYIYRRNRYESCGPSYNGNQSHVQNRDPSESIIITQLTRSEYSKTNGNPFERQSFGN